MRYFYLPDLGEGLPDAEIVKWYVKEGQEIAADEPLVAMETAKAVVDVPSPVAGIVLKLYGKEGDVIETGGKLVEYKSDSVDENSKDTGTVAGTIEIGNEVVDDDIIVTKRAVGGPKAIPAVRALANKLKIDLNLVTPTGPNNTITKKDVETAAGSGVKVSDASNISANKNLEEFVAIKGSRRSMAREMTRANSEVCLVTIVDDACLYKWDNNQDITARIILAMVAACKQEPALNAWYDNGAPSRRVFDSINLGMAVDTEDGLFVPVIKDAQKIDAKDLRGVINTMKQEVSSRSIAPDKLKDATITLSNFGRFIGRYASPIVVPPQVAILGVGELKQEAVVIDGEIKVSRVLPLSLSFDHRACTGGEASRFLGVVRTELEKA